MSDEAKKKNEILELVHLIESNEHDLFKSWDGYFEDGALFFQITPLVCFFSAIFFIFLNVENISIVDFLPLYVAVLLATIALSIAVSSYLQFSQEERIVNCNFKKMKKLHKDDKNLLLKALIKLKYRNQEFNLEQAFNLNPDMFTIERLIEKLYE